jgi:hypothetical protein
VSGHADVELARSHQAAFGLAADIAGAVIGVLTASWRAV